MKHIFISYSHHDNSFMQKLHNSLLSAGLDVWTDKNIQPGTPSWLQSIQQAIDETDAVVVILSPSAKASEWVGKELFYAFLQKVPIIPVLASGSEAISLPFLLVTMQYIDMRHEINWGSSLARLVETIMTIPLKEEVFTPSKEKLQEYIEQANIYVSQLLSIVETMDRQTRQLGNNAFTQIPPYLATNRGSREQKAILRIISEYIMDFSDDIESQLPMFQQIWVGLLNNMSALFSVNPIESAEEEEKYIFLKSSLQTARDGFETGAIRGLQSLKTVLGMLEKNSKDLKRAIKITRPVIEELDSAMRIGVTYLSLLEDKAAQEIIKYQSRTDKS